MTQLQALQSILHRLRQAGGNGSIIIDKRGKAALLVTKAEDPVAAATSIFRRSRRTTKTENPATVG